MKKITLLLNIEFFTVLAVSIIAYIRWDFSVYLCLSFVIAAMLLLIWFHKKNNK